MLEWKAQRDQKALKDFKVIWVYRVHRVQEDFLVLRAKGEIKVSLDYWVNREYKVFKVRKATKEIKVNRVSKESLGLMVMME